MRRKHWDRVKERERGGRKIKDTEVENTIYRSSAYELSNDYHRYWWLYIIVFKSRGYSCQSGLNRYLKLPSVGILHIVQYCLQYCLINSQRWAEAAWMAVEQAQGKAHVRGESIFPAMRSRHLHSAGRSAEPRARRLAPFTLQSRFYSSSTTTLFDSCLHDESIWTLRRHPPLRCSWVFKHWSSR